MCKRTITERLEADGYVHEYNQNKYEDEVRAIYKGKGNLGY